jgi:hypothetical protein
MTTREKLDQMKASEERNAAAEAKYRGASWKQRQVHALNYRYGLRAAQWQAEGHADARDAFVRRFDTMIRGVKSLPANTERYVRAAMEEKLARDRMELDKIIRGFERSEKA